MDPEELQVVLGQLAQTLGVPPPPPLAPDQIASASSVISQLLAALGMAGNMSDPADMAAAEAGQAERELQTGEALTKFPANEEQSAQAMQQVMGMAQQVPQSLSGVGQGLGGVFGGFFQQLNQALQQGVQAGQQFASQLGNVGQAAELAGDLPTGAISGGLGAGETLLGSGGAIGGGLAGTVPAGNLGPPATPSAATFPASSSGPSLPPSAPESAGAGRGGMAGYPLMPPAAMGGASGPGSDTKADTKRVVPPSVKNGAPVQGRISTPPKLPEVTKHLQGKPVASRRIAAPGHKLEEGTEPDR